MKVDIEDSDGVKIVRLHGELIGGHTGTFVDVVTNLFCGPGTRILLDLTEVPYMNSTGLSELVHVTAQANIQEGRVVIARPSPFVAGVLQTSQLDRFFEIAPSVEQGLAKLT
jgi:anti-sigma B factor antagonist